MKFQNNNNNDSIVLEIKITFYFFSFLGIFTRKIDVFLGINLLISLLKKKIYFYIHLNIK